jgi:aminoglycoside/choline kinase family phosphotransferase
MTSRTERIDAFLESSGWEGAARAPLAGDASFRRYERVKHAGKQGVLMDAPPPHEDVRPFINAANTLLALGLTAPQILAQNCEEGFLLLEDLGDDLFSRVLRTTPDREDEFYSSAADVLVKLYEAGVPSDAQFPAYDEALLMRECMLLAEWFLPAVMPQKETLWQKLLKQIPQEKRVLVLRDYHADNLLWLPQRDSVKAVGLLDFQDAVIGSPAYDVVSFLEDARRDVNSTTVEKVITHYLKATGQNAENFKTAYALLGAQRNCKIIGIFVRLCVRDGKSNYLGYLPRVWGHLMNDLKHPMLSELAGWIEKNIKPEWRGVIEPPPARKQATA